jgi:hypothetical protein
MEYMAWTSSFAHPWRIVLPMIVVVFYLYTAEYINMATLLLVGINPAPWFRAMAMGGIWLWSVMSMNPMQ